LVLLAGSALAVSAAVLTAPVASAKVVVKAKTQPVTRTTLDSGARSVTTTKHVHVKLSFEAIRHGAGFGTSDAGRKSTFAVTLQKGVEVHTWRFNLRGGSFTDNGDTGRGHISSGKTQMKPYGSVAVTFSGLGKATTAHCDSLATNVTHRLQIHGTLKLKTHSKWGNWSGKIGLFHGKLQSGHGGDYPRACIPLPPCQAGISWNASKGFVTIEGLTVGTQGRMVATNVIKIATPRGARRFDQVTAAVPAWHLSGIDPPAVPIAGHGGGVSGSATMTGGSGSGYSPECTGTPVPLARWQSSFAQGANPLTFHERIGGSITLPSLANQTLIVPESPV
jgi:hypothetical protein